jgi:hypothetical protein
MGSTDLHRERNHSSHDVDLHYGGGLFQNHQTLWMPISTHTTTATLDVCLEMISDVVLICQQDF